MIDATRPHAYAWSFERRVLRRVRVNEAKCWEWTGARMHNGYGQLVVGGIRYAVHRYVYEQLVGPIPEGLDLDHLCRNRACVNPIHLEPVTRGENLRRGYLAEPRSAKTHCIRGHAFDAANTRISKAGKRQCRSCDRSRKRGADGADSQREARVLG